MLTLIDSNILVYAINMSSPKHEVAQEFLQAHLGKMAIAQQNILETLRVLTHTKFSSPMTSEDAADAVERITSTAQVIFPAYQTIDVAQALIQKYQLKGDAVLDAYLAATALTAGITSIATDNVKDFAKFEQLKVVNPF